MKKTFVFLVFAIASWNSFGQLGIVAGYKTLNAGAWNEELLPLFGADVYPMSGPSIGLDYWFRLKKRRIEFTPELGVQQFENKLEGGSAEHLQVHFQFNTHFYLFDLESDCNCPTFSKDGNFLTKGFFVEISPGAAMLSSELKTADDSDDGRTFLLGGSAGAGLDLGLADWLTVTPLARYYFYPNAGWGGKNTGPTGDADLTQFFAGVKLRVFWKELKGYR